MATVIETSFEAGTLGAENFVSTSATPPSISTASSFDGVRSLYSNADGAAQWGMWQFPSPPSTATFRFYLNVANYAQTNHDFESFTVFNGPQTHNFSIHPEVDGGGNVFLQAAFDYPTHQMTAVAVSEGTYYRVEVKLDYSATGWKVTWGTATGNGSLTTHDTDATGGNTFAADTCYWVLIGANTNAVVETYFDAVKFTNTSADYPLGAIAAPPAATSGRSMVLMGVG